MNKFFLVTSFLVFGIPLCAMEPDKSVRDLHERMLFFAQHCGFKEYEESTPVPADADVEARARDNAAVAEIFRRCELVFGEQAPIAKMYMFFQLHPGARTRYEDFFLEQLDTKSMDVEAFLRFCPDFSCAQNDYSNAFAELRALLEKNRDQFVEWLRSSNSDLTRLAFVSTNNIVCLHFLTNIFRQHNIAFCKPRDMVLNHWARYLRSTGVTVTRFLIDCCGFDPNTCLSTVCKDGRTFDYRTPLLIAVARGYVPLVQILLECGAQPAERVLITRTGKIPGGFPVAVSAISMAETFKNDCVSPELFALLYEAKCRQEAPTGLQIVMPEPEKK